MRLLVQLDNFTWGYEYTTISSVHPALLTGIAAYVKNEESSRARKQGGSLDLTREQQQGCPNCATALDRGEEVTAPARRSMDAPVLAPFQATISTEYPGCKMSEPKSRQISAAYCALR